VRGRNQVVANRGNVHELLKAKEEIEYLVTLHTHRYANIPLPHQLEKKFWCLNLERTKQNISKFWDCSKFCVST